MIDNRPPAPVRLGVLLLALWLAAPAAAQNHPFASHPFVYAAGSIQPNHVSAAVLDQAVRDFYDAWKSRYLLQTCGAGRYVVLANTAAGNLTVSEAHGYGMILMALMAGHDPQARAVFDGMYAYFRDHPTILHDRLMSFYQRKSCGNAEGEDSAADGDLDIAYALLLADKQWGSCGAIDYAGEAAAMLLDVRDGDIDTSGRYITLGDWVTPGDPQYYPSTRSSDFIPGHLRAFAVASGDSLWTDVLDHTYLVVDSVQNNHSPATGLLPDFIADPLGAPAPVAAGFLEGLNDGAYDYNACRDPWRIGTDFLVAGESRAKSAVQRITTWFRATTGNDPSGIESGYQLDGTLSAGADYRSLAFVAPLGVAAMVDSANQAWLNDLWDLIAGTSIDDEAYYENTLKLLSMIVLSGNWWPPDAVGGGCTPDVTPLCANGGYATDLDIKLTRLTSPVGGQSLKLKGKLFFPQEIPAAAPYTDGAQLLIEDLGNGDTAIYEISRFTNPIPALADGTCDPGDGWKATPKSALYRNRSGRLDPPTCSAGSARGLSHLRYKPRSTRDLDVQIKAKDASIAAPLGPLRATFVLGSTQAGGDAGACARSTAVPCTFNASGSTLRCRQ